MEVLKNRSPLLERLNSLSTNEAEAEFHKCCGSRNWTRQMSKERPIGSLDELISKADRIWWSLKPTDWLEAFRSHPKIGESSRGIAAGQTKMDRLKSRSQEWSEQEQSGVRNAAQETMRTLVKLNRKYEERFGYIFIICATGKSSEEMLALLRERLNNDPEKELRIAAEEQSRITQLRLKKLVDQ